MGPIAKQLRIIIISLLFFFAFAQIDNPGTPTNLQIGEVYNISLIPNQQKLFTLTITNPVQEGNNLFITTSSPYNDPFQQPYVMITSNDGFQLMCDDQSAWYTGICEINNKDLKIDRVFLLRLYCLVECKVKLTSYISLIYELQIGTIIQLSSFNFSGPARYVKVNIPQDLQFASILVMAELINYDTAQQGINLLVNYGPNPVQPSIYTYALKGTATYGHRLNVEVTNSQVKPGEQIVIYLFLGFNNTVELSTSVMNGQRRMVSVGYPVIDFVTNSQIRQYLADFSMYDKDDLAKRQILIKFVIYNGYPSAQVFFDETYTNDATQDNWFIQSSFAFLLDPQIRQSKGFTDKLYIKVTSLFSSSYYLQIIINDKPFILLQNQIMQMIKLQPNGIQNFIFEDSNKINEIPQNGIIRYKTKIQMRTGALFIGIRDCDFLTTGVDKCLLNSLDDLKNPDVRKSFDNVQGNMTHYYNSYVILFQYNVTSCPLANKGTYLQRYVCDFHVFVVNPYPPTNPNSQLYCGIQVSKYSQPKQLKQGIMTRDEVDDEGENYYIFSLHSTQNIKRLQFFTTVIQGDITILLSRKKKFPDIDYLANQQDQDDTIYSVNGKIIVEKDQLTAGDYHLGVYGYEASEYLIGTALQRKINNNSNISDITEIWLQKGTSQSHIMNQGETIMKFIFTPSIDNQKSMIQVTSIQGDLWFRVQEKKIVGQISESLCDSFTIQQEESRYCKIITKVDTMYLIIVQSSMSEVSSFVISYTDKDTCQYYPIDYPLTVQLSMMENDGECFKYVIYQYKDMEITIALSQLDRIRSKNLLNISLNFGGKEHQVKISGYQYIIQADQLKMLCQEGFQNKSDEIINTDTSKKCQFEVKIGINGSKKSESGLQKDYIVLMMAVQAFDDENTLFEGIPQKIITQKISTTNPKKFFYYVYQPLNTNTLKIYLSSQTPSQYQIAATVVSQSEYNLDVKGNLYPSFNSNVSKVIVVNSSVYSPITVLSIDHSLLVKNKTALLGERSVVLISVFGIPSSAQLSQIQTYIFKIEATQSQTYLYFGESKIGYVDKDEIYQYQIELSSLNPSLLSIRSLGELSCIKSYIEVQQIIKDFTKSQSTIQIGQVQFVEYKIFNHEKGTRNIIIKGISQDICTYQITFNSLDNPLTSIIKSVPYQIDIDKPDDISYYLYYHKDNYSFLIVMMIDSGNGNIFATSINHTDNITLEDIIKMNLSKSKYQYIGDFNQNVFVDKQSSKYCTQCYYLIAVKGNKLINGELVISLENLPIPLKQGSIMRDKIQQHTNNKTKIYQFYSINDFNLTVNPIYGKVNISVMTPDEQTISKNNIQISTQIKIASSTLSSQKNIDYFDSSSRYLINVSSSSDSSYFISVKKEGNTIRLYQGMPITVEIGNPKGSKGLKVQFSNLEVSTPLNILIYDMNYDTKGESGIDVQVTYQSYTGSNINQLGNLIKNRTKSEGSYNVELNSYAAEYYLTITSIKPTNITLILAKISFTHLVAGRSLMISYPSIFAIFSPGNSIMVQIFSCKGDIQISASSNYSKIKSEGNDDEGVVRMEHGNYGGGHYVISAQNLKGEYYLETKLIADNNLVGMNYVISYYLYDSSIGEKMPYRSYGVMDTNIQYSYKQQSIQFGLNKIYRKDGLKSTNTTVTYTLYISKKSEDITKMTGCVQGNVYKRILTQVGTSIQSTNIEQFAIFKLKTQQIKKIIGNSSTYFVGAEVSATWDNSKPNHVNSVYFVYGILQLVTNNQLITKEENNQNVVFVVLWIVIPFLLGSIVMYFALRYLIKSFTYQPTQLIEEEDVNSHEQFGASIDRGEVH